MPWLVREDEVLASVEIADSLGDRLRGLLGRDGIDGAVVLRPAKSVHTIGMRFDIDVAYCAGDPAGGELTVLATQTMRRYRIGMPRLKARAVIEAEAGAFERWRLKPGDRLELTP